MSNLESGLETKAKFLAKMPHAVILRSASGAIRILVTSADVKRPPFFFGIFLVLPPAPAEADRLQSLGRPNIKCKPFSTAAQQKSNSRSLRRSWYILEGFGSVQLVAAIHTSVSV